MSRPIHKCDMTHSYERTRLIAIHSSTTLCPLISMCHITHSYMQHDSFIRRHDSLEYAAAQQPRHILWERTFSPTLCAPHFASTHLQVSHKPVTYDCYVTHSYGDITHLSTQLLNTHAAYCGSKIWRARFARTHCAPYFAPTYL